MGIVRVPRAELRPFVELVWASDNADPPRACRPQLERMLPSCTTHLVVRLGGDPVEILDDDHGGLAGAARRHQRLGHAVVGGVRAVAYLRRPASSGHTIGAVLRPGATQALIGVEGAELAGRHVGLDEVWGRRAGELQERLSSASSLRAELDLFESLLSAGARRPLGLHPAVAHALELFTTTATVGGVVDDTGYSHRRFNQLFSRAVGLTPKLYCRVARLERLLRRWRATPDLPLAELACAGGYSDQSHLSREFRELAGTTLAAYRAGGKPGSRHAPLPAGTPPSTCSATPGTMPSATPGTVSSATPGTTPGTTRPRRR